MKIYHCLANIRIPESELPDDVVQSLQEEKNLIQEKLNGLSNNIALFFFEEFEFDVEANSFMGAIGESIDYMESIVFNMVANEDEEKDLTRFYEIVGVEESKRYTKTGQMVSFNVVNADNECDCAYCRFDRVSNDEKMEFNCVCGHLIRVADGFESIHCRSCNIEIKRENIKLASNGKYEVNIPKKNKKNRREDNIEGR